MGILSTEDHHTQVEDFNLTGDATTLGHCIPRLLEQAADRHAGKIALICGEMALTFAEVHTRVNQVARLLVRQGIGRGDLVGVVLDRSVELVVVLLAVLKAGAAYIPIDPTLPTARLRLMLDDAGPKLVVVSAGTVPALRDWDGESFRVDQVPSDDAKADKSSHLGIEVHSEDLAYVLFTSGSTGRPKGVEIVHGAVTNFLLSMQREPGCGEEDRLLAVSTISFDTAVLELFLPLLSGATVVVAQTHHIRDARALMALMDRHAITMMIATPTIWQILLDAGWRGQPRLHRLLCGGEAMPRRLGERLLECSDGVWNMYGPTEATVISSCWRVRRGDEVVIGRPLANIQYYLLDDGLSPVPLGTAGELYISGACLARGYLNNPELTQARFVTSPFHEGRLYRTGDLACFLAPQKLQVLGRNDSQVKIWGNRIELGEIEAVIMDHVEISSAVVISRAERLIAYCVRERPHRIVDESHRVDESAPNQLGPLLRPWAAQRLPAYMVPAFFVEIDELPLSPTGKIDHHSLPDPMAEVEVTAMPTTELERQIRMIWSEVLGVDRIGVDDNFFEVGGDSVRIVRAQVRLETLLGRPVAPATLFEHYTIRTLAAHLARAEERRPDHIPARPRKSENHEDIAIISMACRLPGGVTTPEDYWQLLVSGSDATSDVPKDRWDADAFYNADPGAPGKTYCRRGGFLDAIDSFDAAFFGIAPREAHALDPTQHLMLETCWEAFERAGYTTTQLRGSPTGVFIGVSNNPAHHGCVHARSATDLNGYACTGAAGGTISGRVSYVLGLEGPAMTVDTACSSSLVTTHLACAALRRGECDLAISGGAALLLTPGLLIEFSRLRGLSPDGRCRSFAADTQGAGFAEGAAAVVLKRLSDAQRDGDTIHAVLLGSAVNHDGHSAGLTTPSGAAQRRLIHTALAAAALQPEDIDYIEAHGTGTRLGDPIEGTALAEVFGGRNRPPTGDPLWVGSAKSNLAHTQAAAGVAGLLKVVLSLRYNILPQTLHVGEPTSAVDWKGAHMAPVRKSLPWVPRPDRPRRAGVSAFGISGTNAHLVVSEAPEQEKEAAGACSASVTLSPTLLLLLSGTTEAALQQQARKLQGHLARRTEHLGDVAYSLATTRNHFQKRTVVLARDPVELLDRLEAVAAGADASSKIHIEEPRLAMLFPGQGSQLPGMGRNLACQYPVFRAALNEVVAQFEGTLEPPLLDVMWANSDSKAAALLHRTDYAQPALFTLSVALWRLWESWGVRPNFVLGHSVGELAAAYVAGIIDLPDACRLVAARARLMQALPSCGGMVSLEAGAAKVAEAIKILGLTGMAHIAAHNTLTQTVASGDRVALETLIAHFSAQGCRTKTLQVSHAFHSHHMDGMLTAFHAVAETVRFRPPTRAVVSTLTGLLAEPGQLEQPGYWVQQARSPVRFSEGIQTLADRGVNVFLELGPRPALCGLGANCLADDPRMPSTTWLPSLLPGKDDTEVIKASLAALHVRHMSVDWHRYFTPFGCRRVELPTYAFQRQRFPLAHNGFPHAHGDPEPGLDDPRGLKRPAHSTPQAAPGVDRCQFEIQWRREDTSKDCHDACLGGNGLPGRVWGLWLPAGDRAAWAPEVTAGFSRANMKVVRVGKLSDAEALDGLICLWDTSNADVLREAREYMAQGLEQLQTAAQTGFAPPLVWITRQAIGAGTADGAPGLAAAALWGLMRTARLEHPELCLRLIDLDAEAATAPLGILAPVLGPGAEPEYAVRRGQLLVPRMLQVEAAPVPEAADHVQSRLLRRDGAVLITGGLGEIGRHVARWLACTHGITDLVLTSRHGMVAPGAEALVADLSQLGARVSVLASDIADWESVQSVLALFNPNHRPLRGVVHAAGILDDGVLSAMTPQRCAMTFGPKADGVWHLHRGTRDLELDLFLVLSSAAGVMGNPGQANYAAANTFLDALMYQRRAESLPATAVALGLWGGEGMGGSLGRMDHVRYARLGLDPLAPADGLALFERAVRSGRALTVAAAYNLPQLRRHHQDRGGIPPILQLLLPVPDDGRREDPSHSGALRDLREALGNAHRGQHRAIALSRVRDTVARTLGFTAATDVDVDQPLQEIGVDSLTAVLIRNQLAILTGLTLPARIVFDHATLRALSDFLLGQVQKSLKDSSSERDLDTASSATTDLKNAILDMAALRQGCLDPSFIFDAARRLPAPRRPEAVFVTGATGFVGAYIVHDLLQRGIAVHCLVRAGSVEEARKRLVDTLSSYSLWEANFDPLLIPVVGDMAQPLFNLAEAAFSQLADAVDAICHCAALVDWLRPLEDYVGPNIVSTHEALRLAAQGRSKAVHLISTVATVPRYLGHAVSEDEYEYGYATSKWIAERLVAAARWRGCPASIYRLPYVTAAATGHFRRDRGDFLHNLVAGSVEIGSFPALAADLAIVLPVDYLSRTVVAVMIDDRALVGQDFDYANARAPSFVRYFELMGANRQAIVPFTDWRRRAMAHAAAHPTSPLARIAAMLDSCPDDNSAAALFHGPQLGAHVLGGDDYPAPLLDEPTVRRYLNRIQHAQAERSRRERD